MPEPTYRHGKICYIIMPSRDPQQSAAFYSAAFNWNTRSHDDGTLAFDDSTGQVSGMWVTDREAVDNPGAEVHIMVDNADRTEQAIVEHGGTLVWRAGPEESEVYGTFRDPSGNLFGYYQHAGLDD